MLDESDLVGFENWTMIVNKSDIWKHILVEVLPKLKKRAARPVLFIDMACREKRSMADISEAMGLIGQFSSYYQVILGLNKKEACEIASIFGMPVHLDDFDAQELQPLAEFIFAKMQIDALVIHPVKEACVVTREGYARMAGPYCQKPKLTTGAGDNFNAGFILGVTMGLAMEESLALGSATSGFYVLNAHSPDLSGIRKFLEDWSTDNLE